MKISHLLALLASVVIFPATAQSVYHAENVHIQSQIGRDENGFTECGLRLVMSDSIANATEFYEIILTAFPKYGKGAFAVIKKRMTDEQLRIPKKGPANIVVPGPVKFWITKSTDAKPVTAAKYLESDTPGILLGGLFLTETVSILTSIIEGATMQFAASYSGQEGDRVVSFKASLPKDESESLYACLGSGGFTSSDGLELLNKMRAY